MYDLTKLREATNQVLREILGLQLEGAINRADLRCVEASFKVNDKGYSYYEVLVEEADPNNRELRSKIVKSLEKAGWNDVAVSEVPESLRPGQRVQTNAQCMKDLGYRRRRRGVVVRVYGDKEKYVEVRWDGSPEVLQYWADYVEPEVRDLR